MAAHLQPVSMLGRHHQPPRLRRCRRVRPGLSLHRRLGLLVSRGPQMASLMAQSSRQLFRFAGTRTARRTGSRRGRTTSTRFPGSWCFSTTRKTPPLPISRVIEGMRTTTSAALPEPRDTTRCATARSSWREPAWLGLGKFFIKVLRTVASDPRLCARWRHLPSPLARQGAGSPESESITLVGQDSNLVSS